MQRARQGRQKPSRSCLKSDLHFAITPYAFPSWRVAQAHASRGQPDPHDHERPVITLIIESRFCVAEPLRNDKCVATYRFPGSRPFTASQTRSLKISRSHERRETYHPLGIILMRLDMDRDKDRRILC